MSLVRMAASMLSKSSASRPNLPQNSSFVFSTSGTALLFWSVDTAVSRFDLSPAEASVGRSCQYDVVGAEYVSAGEQRCAVIATNERGRNLYIFGGHETAPEAIISVPSSPRNHIEGCLTVSRDDRFIAYSLDDVVRVYRAGDPPQQIALQDQMQSYKGPSQQKAAAETARQRSSKKPLSPEEQEREARREQIVIGRRLCFSPDSRHLIVATHLGDRSVHLDVWRCQDEEWQIHANQSRSVRFPQWTTNDGDITCVFYDGASHSAFLTAYISKEYPVLVPLLGSSTPNPESWGSRVIHAAQAPLGFHFVTANGRNEIALFDQTAIGTLNPRRLKRSSKGIPSSAFKPHKIALSMPSPSRFRMFWVKDGAKPCLRTVDVDEDSEYIQDVDLRPAFEELIQANMGGVETLTGTSRRTEAASTLAHELDSTTAADSANAQIQELADTQIQELPGTGHWKE